VFHFVALFASLPVAELSAFNRGRFRAGVSLRPAVVNYVSFPDRMQANKCTDISVSLRKCVPRVGRFVVCTVSGASIPMGQGDTSPNIWTGGHYHECPPNISRVISATFYPCNIFLIS